MFITPRNPENFTFETAGQANPAAGANFIWTVPTNTLIQVISVRFNLTTDATVANRVPQFYGYIAAAIHFNTPPAVVQAASLARSYAWTVGGQPIDYGIAASTVFGTLPDYFYLRGGNSVRSIITNIAATDQIAGIIFAYKQWIEPA